MNTESEKLVFDTRTPGDSTKWIRVGHEIALLTAEFVGCWKVQGGDTVDFDYVNYQFRIASGEVWTSRLHLACINHTVSTDREIAQTIFKSFEQAKWYKSEEKEH